MGGILGLILGLLISFFPPLGIPVGIDVILLVGVAGASIGGLGTGLMGAAFPSSRLKPFAKEIKAGKIAVIADVPPDRVSHVNGMIRQLDPEVDIGGIEPRASIIPK